MVTYPNLCSAETHNLTIEYGLIIFSIQCFSDLRKPYYQLREIKFSVSYREQFTSLVRHLPSLEEKEPIHYLASFKLILMYALKFLVC